MVVFVDNLLRADALFFGAYRYGSAVLIGSAHPYDISAHAAQVAHINICRQVGSRQMPQVQGPVGVG